MMVAAIRGPFAPCGSLLRQPPACTHLSFSHLYFLPLIVFSDFNPAEIISAQKSKAKDEQIIKKLEN